MINECKVHNFIWKAKDKISGCPKCLKLFLKEIPLGKVVNGKIEKGKKYKFYEKCGCCGIVRIEEGIAAGNASETENRIIKAISEERQEARQEANQKSC